MKTAALLLILTSPAGAQFLQVDREPPAQWLPRTMAYPAKVSPDRFADDEYPSIARDSKGGIWLAWSSCRPESKDWPATNANINAWQWPDDGADSIAVRRWDNRGWAAEQIVSAEAGINHKPAIVVSGDQVRVLWTSRRKGRWAAYEAVWSNGQWSPEAKIPDSEDTLEVRASALSDGAVLAVFRRMVAPRIELAARVVRDGRWQQAARLDEGVGRCHRPNLLAQPGGGWMVAWDEEREGNYDIFVRNSQGPAQRLTGTALWDTAPALARTTDGRIWAVWETRETVGGRFTYRGRSIFGKVLEGGRWQWIASPYPTPGDPGRLTRHGTQWAAQGISEERYPNLVARANGDLWLLWLGGGRMSSVALTGRRLRGGQWSEPRLLFHDPMPYSAFQLPSAQPGRDLRTQGRGPYQTPLANQLVWALDDAGGDLWLGYEVPRRRHITDRFWTFDTLQRPSGYGADIYSHRVDLDEREVRFPVVVDDRSAVATLEARPYRKPASRTVTMAGKPHRLVWGDTHGHTENDGIGSFDMYYAHGLFVAGMDYLAATNHDFTPDFLTQSEWAETQALASVYNAIPGKVAMSGWEWTTEAQDERGGHRAMYFMRDDQPLYRSTTRSSSNVWKLYSLLRGRDVILQPHHNSWTGYDPDLQPIFEITSAWRQAREESRQFKKEGPVDSVWEALERGYRIGFVGSGDTHWLGPGEDFGITGAYVDEFSRKGIFDAVRARRVYASSGARLVADVRVNGAMMGGQTSAAAGPIQIEVDIAGDAELERVEIVKDHAVIYAAPGEGARRQFRYEDRGGPRADGKASYYYVRAKQKDRMYVWTSPAWVDWK